MVVGVGLGLCVCMCVYVCVKRNKAVDPKRFDCPCGEVWRAELEPDNGVLAARFQLVCDRLPEKVLEVLQKDARFVWDWERDEPVPPVE